MTWTFKHTRSDRPMIAEYLCPVHGRFELTVERDANGDPPAEMPCPALGLAHPLYQPRPEDSARDFREAHRRGDRRCDKASPFAISKPGFSKVKNVEAVRGGYEKPARETYTDTTNLGEGQSLEDWEGDRAKVWERERERQVMEMTREL